MGGSESIISQSGRPKPNEFSEFYEYFLSDALGSVRQLVDETGTVTLAQAFQPYGETLSSAGTGSTTYGYTGEWTDSYIKLIYLRSRYYAPETGRFITKDVWPGDYTRPLSLNGWLYTYANPVNWVDPSGMCAGDGPQPTGTPTPPGYSPPCPEPERPPQPPGQPLGTPPPSQPVFDGYLVGGGTMIIQGIPRPNQPGNPLYSPIGPPNNACTAFFLWNAAVAGRETVYDFAHLQKADFVYNGLAAVPSTLMGGQGYVYEGFTSGFSSFNDPPGINAYSEYFMSVSVGAGAPILRGLGSGSGNGAFAFPVNANGSPASGVTAFAYGPSLGLGLGVGVLLPIDASVTLTYYTLQNNTLVDFVRNANGDRVQAKMDMLRDLGSAPISGPGKNLAISILYVGLWEQE